MTIIEPTKRSVQNPERTKTYSATLRFWHWANMIIIAGSLLTVLLNSTVLDDRSDAAFLKTELQKSGAAVTNDQTQTVAHALSDKVWGIHIYFGYGLTALLLFRLILEFFQLADQKFIRILKMAYNKLQQTKKERETARHDFFVKLIYSAFYFLLLLMVLTGLFLAFEDFFAPYKSIRPSVRSFHGFCMYLVLAFITVHLLGVFLAERKDSKGIVSDMINGGGDKD
ncbi:MAG: Ni,Fe-hydrogenase cytochrome b subunit [Mucilaginibacter sp.]|nr:Ni,Fe-hydrogenase cytochrome b subunit [Mucilaginibacter sp.]